MVSSQIPMGDYRGLSVSWMARTSGLSADDPVRLGDCELIGRLHQGGWGLVYLGRRARTMLAIRVLEPSWMAADDARWTLAQAMIAARRAVSLACTVRAFAFELDHSTPHIVSEAAEGPTVRDVVEVRGPFTREGLDQLAVDTLAALAVVHGAHLVHRDLNPASIALPHHGPRLTDLGLSRLTTVPPGAADGVWPYTAPEVLRGSRPEAPADVFGWAATLAFAAGGHAPFPADDAESYRHAIAAGRHDLTGLPPHLLELAVECLADDPADRPSAGQALDRLIRVLPAAVSAQPAPLIAPNNAAATSPPAKLTRPSTRRPVLPTRQDRGNRASRLSRTAAEIARRTFRSLGSLARRAGPCLGNLARRAGPFVHRLTRRPGRLVPAALAVVIVAVGVPFAITHWPGDPGHGRPAVTSAAPRCGQTIGLSALAFDPSQGCYGFADSGAGFGRDAAVAAVQSKILARNRPPASGDLTVIWLGQLTCPSYLPSGACRDGRIHDSERQELEGLQLAQLRTDLGTRLHLVIANGGADFTHVKDVAQMITAHRASFGRVVVICSGDSRDATRQALDTLLAARIPVIAPNLSADTGAPGQTFITRSGYLQLSAPNQEWAGAAVDFIAAHTPVADHRQVIVYHVPVDGDNFTQSLADDVVAAAEATPAIDAQAPQVVTGLRGIPTTVCRDAPARTLPPALFFADRATSFRQFATGLTALCGPHGPAMLVANSNVGQFMTSDAARQTVTAPWPMAYFRRGQQCSELERAAGQAPRGESGALLSLAGSVLGLCVQQPGGSVSQIGDRVAQFWAAAALATKLVTPGTPEGGLADTTINTAVGAVTVQGGRVVARPAPSSPLCVKTVDLSRSSSRSVDTCDSVFGPAVA